MSGIDPTRRCKRVEEWPELDQAAWTAALQPSDDPDQSKVAEHWSDGTRHCVVSGYGRWLTWLEQHGWLDPQQSPAERVTAERVAAYTAELRQEVAVSSVANRIEQLGNALRALAPERAWQSMQHAATELRRSHPRRPSKSAALAAEAKSAAAGSRPSQGLRCMPVSEWPAPDQAAWAASLQPGDVFDAGGVAAGWAPATQKMAVAGYGRFLTWHSARGDLDPTLPPASRVGRTLLFAYVQDLRVSVAPHTVATCIEEVGHALRALAPDQDWRWIQRAADRLRGEATSVRGKAAKLQTSEQLVQFGMALMARADDPATGRPIWRATDYRDGLMISLLALRPIRRRNLAAIRCDQHLVRRGSEWWLVFGTDTKTKRSLEFPFPGDLVPLLQRYLQQHRPLLMARGPRRSVPVTALWVSSHGTQMGPAAITHQVRRHTGLAFDEALGPHMFRDCAATTLAVSAPEEVHLIKSILGHTTLATSERHYNLAGSLQAGRRHAKTIATLRNQKG